MDRWTSSCSVAICLELAGHKRKSLQRRMKQLFEVAQIATRVAGRKKQLVTTHSTRVGAVCYLLKAGLSEAVVSGLVQWSSQQVQRCGNRPIVDPGLVQAFAFLTQLA